MVIWIPTFRLTALPQCWQLAPIMASQHNKWCHILTSFPVQKIFCFSIFFKKWHHKMVKLSKIMPTLLFFLSKKKHDIQKFRDCIRPNSEKSENKQKICFLLMSANKDSLCSGIQTYFLWSNNYLSIILWCFSNIPPLEAKSYRFLLWASWKLMSANSF